MKILTRFTAALCLALLTAASGMVVADPVPQPPPLPVPPPVIPPVFCFRFTDIEKLPGDVTGNAFRLEFEVLNWSNLPASGLNLMTAIGSTAVGGTSIPLIAGQAIDPDGRGGPLNVGAEIGAGIFDPVPVHSGRGRGDLPGLTNDWAGVGTTPTTAAWSGLGGTAIPFRDLIGTAAAPGATQAMVDALIPGVPPRVDALGDPAVDGGPLPYGPGLGGGQPVPDGSGNVLDGFVLDVFNFHVGEIIALNWFLSSPLAVCAPGFAGGSAIGTPGPGPLGVPAAGCGNAFGFGVFNLMRIPIGAPLVGPPVFFGNTGMLATNQQFVFAPGGADLVTDPAQFVAEFGAGITAPFFNPANNIGNVQPNTLLINVVPEPSSLLLLLAGGIGLGWRLRPRKVVH